MRLTPVLAALCAAAVPAAAQVGRVAPVEGAAPANVALPSFGVNSIIPGNNLDSGPKPGEFGSIDRSLDGSSDWSDFSTTIGYREGAKLDRAAGPREEMRDVPMAPPRGAPRPVTPPSTLPDPRLPQRDAGSVIARLTRLFRAAPEKPAREDESAPESALDHLSRESVFPDKPIGSLGPDQARDLGAREMERKMGGESDAPAASAAPAPRVVAPRSPLGEARAKVVIEIRVPQGMRPEDVLAKLHADTRFERRGAIQPVQPDRHKVTGWVPARAMRALGTHDSVAEIMLAGRGAETAGLLRGRGVRSEIELVSPLEEPKPRQFLDRAVERLVREAGMRLVQNLETRILSRAPGEPARIVLLGEFPPERIGDLRGYSFVSRVSPLTSPVPPPLEPQERKPPEPEASGPLVRETTAGDPRLVVRTLDMAKLSTGFAAIERLSRSFLSR